MYKIKHEGPAIHLIITTSLQNHAFSEVCMSVVIHSIRSRDIAGSPLCTMLNGELTEQLVMNSSPHLKFIFIVT